MSGALLASLLQLAGAATIVGTISALAITWDRSRNRRHDATTGTDRPHLYAISPEDDWADQWLHDPGYDPPLLRSVRDDRTAR